MNIAAVIYFGLLLTVSVAGLDCHKCNHENHGYVTCQVSESCFKVVVYSKNNDRNSPDYGKQLTHISRGCINRNLSSPDSSGCQSQEDLSKPHRGIICLCSDKDYCNGVESFRNVNLVINRQYLLSTFLTAVFHRMFAYILLNH